MTGRVGWCTRLRALWPALLLALGSGEAVAGLGQAYAAPPLAAGAGTAPAARRLAATPGVEFGQYTRHATQLESGTTVHEYARADGLVFAVAWRGPVLPDLSALLGGYFTVFKFEADQARESGRRGSPVRIARPDLVVRSNGRMRNFFGHAYAPDLVPAGVDIHVAIQHALQ